MVLYLNVQRFNPFIYKQTNKHKFYAKRQEEEPIDSLRLTQVEDRQNSPIKSSVLRRKSIDRNSTTSAAGSHRAEMNLPKKR